VRKRCALIVYLIFGPGVAGKFSMGCNLRLQPTRLLPLSAVPPRMTACYTKGKLRRLRLQPKMPPP